jgi:hypothetical protein
MPVLDSPYCHIIERREKWESRKNVKSIKSEVVKKKIFVPHAANRSSFGTVQTVGEKGSQEHSCCSSRLVKRAEVAARCTAALTMYLT